MFWPSIAYTRIVNQLVNRLENICAHTAAATAVHTTIENSQVSVYFYYMLTLGTTTATQVRTIACTITNSKQANELKVAGTRASTAPAHIIRVVFA